MNYLVCIDDTDNLESRGTGELAELIAAGIEERGWGSCSVVTRHQLLLHEDIPYTSHNSSMCFQVEASDSFIETDLIRYAGDFLGEEHAEGSDPGLAVADLAALEFPNLVIEFGQLAKLKVLTKDAAYDFAHEHGIHLSEHGGTGQGVIGALAGIGLRMSGHDGRIKGKLKLGAEGDSLSVEELLKHPQIDRVQNLEGLELKSHELVRLGEKVKTVWLNHQAVLMVFADGADWTTCGRQQLRTF